MRTAAIIAAAIIFATAATADTTKTTCERNYLGKGVTCSTTTYGPRPPEVLPALTSEDRARERARESHWVDFCRPTLSAPDRDGMRRYVYAQPGCDLGRTE